MFIGQFERSIDSKNRVVLPPSFKNDLGNIFYLTISSGKKLEIRNVQEFENFVDKIDQNNQLDPNIQKYKRFILARTIKVETDKLGRFLIPENFLKAIAIKKTISFVGMGRIIEIWASENLEMQLDELENDSTIDDLAAEMLKKGYKL
ncbi:division/cell wall cluster transcriptional repressor MraZ [Metamycoplasma sualvi]|uniref:division/cell wall cluster transcriptional repressor MraZ n=1 Tax=Metamycoplasma sualvi TaxID=2125 RepID=UPI0038733A36